MWGPPRRNHTEKSPRFDVPAQKISIEGKEISTDYDDIDKDDDDNADTFSFKYKHQTHPSGLGGILMNTCWYKGLRVL